MTPRQGLGLTGAQKEAPSAEAGGYWGCRNLTRCPPQQMADTRYLSKGRGLPRRLVTTATQCWDARTYTLCWADCSTCSSRLSCSLERSTLMISGTYGWWVRRQTWKQAARSQVLSMGPWEGAAQELQGRSWGRAEKEAWCPLDLCGALRPRGPNSPSLPIQGVPASGALTKGQWAGMEEREEEADRPPTEAGMGQEREGHGLHCEATNEATSARSLLTGLLILGPRPQQVLAPTTGPPLHAAHMENTWSEEKTEETELWDRAAGRRCTHQPLGPGQGWPRHLPNGTPRRRWRG